MGVSTDNIGSVSYGPTAQADAYAVRASLDARGYRSVSFTLIAATQDAKWTVYGANQSDYSDEVVVQNEATVAAGANGSYAATQAPYGFYRVKVKNSSAGQNSTVTVQGYAKP